MTTVTPAMAMLLAGSIGSGVYYSARELPDELKPLAIGMICAGALLVLIKVWLPRFPLKICLSALILAGAFLARSLTGYPGFVIGALGVIALLYILDFFSEVMPPAKGDVDVGTWD